MTTLEKIRAEIDVIEINGQVDEHTAFIRTGEHVKQMALDIIDKYAEQEPKWISVSERLPEDHDWYLIVVKEKSTGYQYIPRVASHLHDNDWCMIDTEDADEDWLNDLRCVAWMPLPEPYKAESEDKE